MPETLTNIEDLRSYLRGIVAKARHHANDIENVLFSLAGAVVLFKDPNIPLEVRTYRGNVKNAIWITIRGNRFALSYNHEHEVVEIRRDNLQGPVIDRFDNTTPLVNILTTFRSL